ncbi:hypothetical protein [Achromobacter insuavis]|uniref:hypothetical protein n=1 Tax=Achromobacter insuavis TaxID=1287735 RepID=UPI0029DCECF5|nr:hypothetical protein [Achromobacter sp.]MCG2601724.1 hypothetical protein [Achromobacter sp.]
MAAQKERNALELAAGHTGGMKKITETEALLLTAQDIARRTFVDPSEAAVLAIFEELRIERDRMAWATDDRVGATVH